MARLRIVRGREIGRTLDLGKETFLGRDDGNTLKLLDETSSRRHAKIEGMEGRFLLFDLGSNNGSLVNGEKVKERLLRDGDQIQLGKTVLVFEDDAQRGKTVVVIEESPAIQIESTLETTSERAIEEAGDPKAAFDRLKRLYEVTALLNSSLDPRTLAEGLVGLLMESIGADTVAVVLEGAEPLGRSRASRGDLEISHAVLERARRERKALLVSCAMDDPALAKRESVIQERIASMICAPLMRGERWLGAIYADIRKSKRKFTEDELAFATAAAHQAALAFENAEKYSRAVAASPGDLRIIGDDPAFRDALLLAEKAAATDATVLVLGESGTGKELVARLVHERSPRRGGPFVAINCAALVETLLESELFGHEKGAFTGAVKATAGKFEVANGGTVFLDEIGELSPGLQAKLLRVLQEKKYYRVGGTRPITSDARIVAATNRELAKAVKEGKFREDLYYRLSVVAVTIPPLRARRADIPLLAKHFVERLAQKLKKPKLELSKKVVQQLETYPWPGNVRELENVLERAAILTDGPEIESVLLPDAAPAAEDLPYALEALEKIAIERALRKTGGKKGEAATLLGISHPTLNKKIRDYGIVE